VRPSVGALHSRDQQDRLRSVVERRLQQRGPRGFASTMHAGHAVMVGLDGKAVPNRLIGSGALRGGHLRFAIV
jgi:hypothetical protein